MRRYVVLSIISLALLLSSITGSSVAVAFPVVISNFNISLVLAGWILTVYSVVSTICMPLAGRISESLGRRTTFIACTCIFFVGSALCALSPNVYLLICARVVQAIGGAAFLPCSAGIVFDLFPESRQRSIGLLTSVMPVGMIIGPNLGGWMVETFGWRSIFWLDVPIGIIIVLLAVWLLPRGGKKRGGGGIDFIGAGLLFASIFAFNIGLTALGSKETGIPWLPAGISFVLGTGLILAFLRREVHSKEPLIGLELLKRKPFLAANIYNMIYGACALGIFMLIPLYAVSIYNMSTFESGILLTPRSVAMVAASAVTSFFLYRWGYRWPIIVGTLIVAAGVLVLAFQPHGLRILGMDFSTALLLFIVMGVCGMGVGIAAPASSNACIELLPDQVATITGLRGMFRQLGSAFGIAMATFVIHVISDARQAFYVVFIAVAVIMLMSIPAILAMPRSGNVCDTQTRVK